VIVERVRHGGALRLRSVVPGDRSCRWKRGTGDQLRPSGNFRVLGIEAGLGRLFTSDDDRADAPPVAVISTGYWQKRFGGDPAAVGKVIRVNDVPLTIIGVTPGEFASVQHTLGEQLDISFTLSLDARLKASTGRAETSQLTSPTAWWLQVMGRLRGGASLSASRRRRDW